jgi:6-phosphogluconolactonase (cycloisomerase 2 family)
MPVRTRTMLLLAAIGLLSGLLTAGHQAAYAGDKGGFLYALINVDGATNRLYGFQVNPATGVLSLLPGFPIAPSGGGHSFTTVEYLTYDAVNHRLYVLNDGSNTLNAYSVNPVSGALASLPFSPIRLDDRAWMCLAVHPSGSPLLVGSGSPIEFGQVMSFTITPGNATVAGTFDTDDVGPYSCAFSQDGAYFYPGGGRPHTGMVGFSVDRASGMLTALPNSPYHIGGGPVAYALDSTGRLFLANAFDNQIRVFTTSAGVPAAVQASPFSAGVTVGTSTLIHGVLHPAGFYMVAERLGNRVCVYRIAGIGAETTIRPVDGSPFAAGGSETHILALNDDTSLLFAANATSRNITTFAVNSANGALTIRATQPADSLGSIGRISGMAFVINTPLTLSMPLIRR